MISFMNVTIIYGTVIESSTYNCVQLLLNTLRKKVTTNTTEIFIQNKLPQSSEKFFSIINSNWNFSSAYDISKSLYKADLIILASSVSTCDISNEMKYFLKNLSTCYMANKTDLSIKNKIGLVISTTSGAGLFYANKVLKRNLNLWGIKNILEFSETIYEIDWKHISEKTMKNISKKIYKLSNKILITCYNPPNVEAPIHDNKLLSENNHNFNNSCSIIDFGHFKNHRKINITNI
jgi:multimeric flavodoxin WrbA